MKVYGVTVVLEKGKYSVEVDDIGTGDTVRYYDEVFNTFQEADEFIEREVEKTYPIRTYHQKVVD
jgi:hypothetical protein